MSTHVRLLSGVGTLVSLQVCALAEALAAAVERTAVFLDLALAPGRFTGSV